MAAADFAAVTAGGYARRHVEPRRCQFSRFGTGHAELPIEDVRHDIGRLLHRLRIAVHDYGVIPVVRLSSASAVTRCCTALDGFRQPKGPMSCSSEAGSLSIEAGQAQRDLGARISGRISLAAPSIRFDCCPDFQLSAGRRPVHNAPLEAGGGRHKAVRVGFVFWLQDRHRSPLPGSSATGSPCWRSRGGTIHAPRTSPSPRVDAVIATGIDALSQRSGVPDDRVEVVENWAPLDETPSANRELGGSGIAGRRIILYAGTRAEAQSGPSGRAGPRTSRSRGTACCGTVPVPIVMRECRWRPKPSRVPLAAVRIRSSDARGGRPAGGCARAGVSTICSLEGPYLLRGRQDGPGCHSRGNLPRSLLCGLGAGCCRSLR